MGFFDSEERLKKLQGEKSRLIGSTTEIHIGFLIQQQNLTNDELRTQTKLSAPALAKHLKSLLQMGFIYKDTVKQNETDDPKRVGRVVYRRSPSKIDLFARQLAGMREIIPDLGLPESMKKELEKHYDAIAEIWSSYLKAYTKASEEAEEESERLDKEYAEKERE